MRKRPNRAEGEEREAAASHGLAADGPLLGEYCCLLGLVADCVIYRLAKYLASSPLPPLPCFGSSHCVPSWHSAEELNRGQGEEAAETVMLHIDQP